MQDRPGRPRLLVIDDDPAWRSLYRLEFQDRFEVLEASDGRDGLEKLEPAPPDLVILDLSMPRMDGTRFLACLDDRGRTIPVIVCTGLDGVLPRFARPSVRIVSKSPDLTELSRAVLALWPLFQAAHAAGATSILERMPNN